MSLLHYIQSYVHYNDNRLKIRDRTHNKYVGHLSIQLSNNHNLTFIIYHFIIIKLLLLIIFLK